MKSYWKQIITVGNDKLNIVYDLFKIIYKYQSFRIE